MGVNSRSERCLPLFKIPAQRLRQQTRCAQSVLQQNLQSRRPHMAAHLPPKRLRLQMPSAPTHAQTSLKRAKRRHRQ